MMSNALLIAENAALWSPCHSSPQPFAFFGEWEIYLLTSWSKLQTDMTTAVRVDAEDSAQRDQGSLSQRKQRNPKRRARRSPLVSALRLSSVFGFETDIQTHRLIKMDCCIWGNWAAAVPIKFSVMKGTTATYPHPRWYLVIILCSQDN